MPETKINLEQLQDANYIAGLENAKLAMAAINSVHNMWFNCGSFQIVADATILITLRSELRQQVAGIESKYILLSAIIWLAIALIGIALGKWLEYKESLQSARVYDAYSRRIATFKTECGLKEIESSQIPEESEIKDERRLQVFPRANFILLVAFIALIAGTILNIIFLFCAVLS